MTELDRKLEELKGFLVDDGYNENNIVYQTFLEAQNIAFRYTQVSDGSIENENFTVGDYEYKGDLK